MRGLVITVDTVWDGRIVIDGTAKVSKGATLTVRPGTEVVFLPRDDDHDGIGDGTLIVEGGLNAEGTPAQPIRWRSAAAPPHPGDWLGIRIDFSTDVRLRWCEISDAVCALHTHSAQGRIEDCVLRGNIDGCRFDQANFILRNSLIEENEGNGVSLRNAPAEIVHNIIRYNATGIFLDENALAFSIRANNIHDNGGNFHLGATHTADVRLVDNWWGTGEPRAAEKIVYDRRRNDAIGLLPLDPAPAWVAGSGPRQRLTLREAWRFETDGFVDAAPVVGNNVVYIPSWDGNLYSLDGDGKLLWKKNLGDVVDAAPGLASGAIYVQNWQRDVYALDRRNGREIWRFTYAPSAADNHRQGSVVRAGDLLLAPAWNGTLFALDAVTGGRLWQAEAGLPLRTAPAVGDERIYQASGSGLLSAWSLAGTNLWQLDLGAPLLASPAITGNGLVAVNRDGVLIALDRNGKELWRRELGEECSYGAPLYDGRALYVGTAAGALWKLNADNGRTIWRYAASGPLYAQPLLTEGLLIVGDNSAQLLVIGADSGDLVTSFHTEGEIQGTPARLGDRLIFGSRDHHVYALEMLPGEAKAVISIP